MTKVLLVTCEAMPEGEEWWGGTTLLVDAFAERGLDARWVAWTDRAVDWQDADVVAVRATWDYETRHQEFLTWARSVGPTLLNGADAFAWNTDKSYLLGLASAGLPVVPTVMVDREDELPAAIAEFEQAVVKPRVGAGGRGLVVFDDGPAGPDESGLVAPPWIVQPLVQSVRTEGETSVFVFGGVAVSQAVKRPAGEEIRVHEQYGGATYAAELTEEATGIAVQAVQVAGKLLGTELAYARVDLMRLDDGRLVVSELEATEPGLYLDVLPGNAQAFADLVARLV